MLVLNEVGFGGLKPIDCILGLILSLHIFFRVLFGERAGKVAFSRFVARALFFSNLEGVLLHPVHPLAIQFLRSMRTLPLNQTLLRALHCEPRRVRHDAHRLCLAQREQVQFLQQLRAHVQNVEEPRRAGAEQARVDVVRDVGDGLVAGEHGSSEERVSVASDFRRSLDGSSKVRAERV